MSLTNERKRYFFLDELRGFAVLCMVVYHGFFTIGIFGIDLGERLIGFFMPFEPFFAGLFIIISGICSVFSRSNARRGGILFGISLVITAATVVLESIGIIWAILFGILHLLAVSMLLAATIIRPAKRLSATAGLVMSSIFLLMFFLFFNIPNGYLGFGNLKLMLPQSFYFSKHLFFIGLPNAKFSSADYFPILPWIFLFLSGLFIGTAASKIGFPQFFTKKRSRFFVFVGSHALVIYVAHQPIIFAILYVANLIFKF